jgi:hypothetical protein
VTALQDSKQARTPIFSNVVLQDVVLDGIDFSGSTFLSATLDGASFVGARSQVVRSAARRLPVAIWPGHVSTKPISPDSRSAVELEQRHLGQRHQFPRLRYADENGQLFPSPTDWMPMNYAATVGLTKVLQASTVCPNGLTWAACAAQGLITAQALAAAVAAPN